MEQMMQQVAGVVVLVSNSNILSPSQAFGGGKVGAINLNYSTSMVCWWWAVFLAGGTSPKLVPTWFGAGGSKQVVLLKVVMESRCLELVVVEVVDVHNQTDLTGGNGGSGVVVVRYQIATIAAMQKHLVVY